MKQTLVVIFYMVATVSYAQTTNATKQLQVDVNLSKKIIGRWKTPSSSTNTISPDGSFVIMGPLFSNPPPAAPIGTWWFGGTWEVTNGVFVMIVTKSSIPETTKFGVRQQKIIRVNERELVMVDWGETNVYTRTNVNTRIE